MSNPTRVKFWSFEAPLRTENGMTLTSVVEGQDPNNGTVVESIEVYDSGMVRIVFGSGMALRVMGRAFGYEETDADRAAKKKRKASEAAADKSGEVTASGT